jgi:hypothetical protein
VTGGFSIRIQLHGDSTSMSTEFVYVKFVGHDLKVPHHRHVCNCRLVDTTLHKIY